MTIKTSSKEVIDYLRNQQKAREIESKVNGVNIWVLLGSLAIISWQLLQGYQPTSSAAVELFLHICVISQLGMLLISIQFVSDSQVDKHVRFLGSISDRIAFPFLSLLYYSLVIFPSALLIYLSGFHFANGLLFLFNLIGVIFTIIAVIKAIFDLGKKTLRFPGQAFSPNPTVMRKFEVLFGAACMVGIFLEIGNVIALRPFVDLPVFKFVILEIACFWLIMTLLVRKSSSSSDAWTYALERDLLIGSISVGAAIRRIEHRALGARLSEVIDDFFAEIEEKLEALEKTISDIEPSIESILGIPEEYPDERAARFHNLVKLPKKEYDAIMSDHNEFMSYMKKLVANSRRASFQGDIKAVLTGILERHEIILARTKTIGGRLSKGSP